MIPCNPFQLFDSIIKNVSSEKKIALLLKLLFFKSLELQPWLKVLYGYILNYNIHFKVKIWMRYLGKY